MSRHPYTPRTFASALVVAVAMSVAMILGSIALSEAPVMPPTLMEAEAHVEAPPLDDVGRAQLQFCESTNRYELKHLDVNGLYSYGAYQFQQATWDQAMTEMFEITYAGSTQWIDWIGVPPNLAPPYVQDMAATWWWDSGRHRAWPHCHKPTIEAMVSAPVADVPVPTFAG